MSLFSRATLLCLLPAVLLGQSGDRLRVRDLGLAPGVLPTGPLNAITDVRGVQVGHVTLLQGDSVRTGVTAVVPHEGNLFQSKVPAAIIVGNGFGKLVGLSQVEELGELESPIVLTNTLSVWVAAQAVADYLLGLPGNELVRSVNPVVGETNDGILNDIRRSHVTKDDVLEAIRRATSGAVEEGSVGAGTGTVCFGWKGGIGTSSRKLPDRMGGYTVGVLVQTNFNGILQIDGVPVGRELGRYFLDDMPDGGSCMIVVATDAPLDASELRRLARRSLSGLARTGSAMTHGSGDYVIAFSTSQRVRREAVRPGSLRTQEVLPQEQLSPLFEAAIEATEEAIYNSLLMATTTTGNGLTVEALPVEPLREILRKFGRIQ